MPNYDDLHYVFLTQSLQMKKQMYDFGNSLTYILLFVFLPIYNKYLIHVQVWKLILFSLFLFWIMTGLMLLNATR